VDGGHTDRKRELARPTTRMAAREVRQWGRAGDVTAT